MVSLCQHRIILPTCKAADSMRLLILFGGLNYWQKKHIYAALLGSLTSRQAICKEGLINRHLHTTTPLWTQQHARTPSIHFSMGPANTHIQHPIQGFRLAALPRVHHEGQRHWSLWHLPFNILSFQLSWLEAKAWIFDHVGNEISYI